MPLVRYTLEILKNVLDTFRDDPGRLGKVASFSVPDVVARPEVVREIFGLKEDVGLREDSAASINWHKAQHITDRLVDTGSLFNALGYEYVAVDITRGRGGEIEFDLNDDLVAAHPRMYEAFDLVHDIVSNQVFNVGQCMANAAQLVRVGGCVMHTVPVCMVNQGFYCCSPTLYHDFYAANGFEVTYRAVVGVYQYMQDLDLHPVNRCRGVHEDAMNVVVARKVRPGDHVINRPIMTKFVQHPKCQFDTPR